MKAKPSKYHWSNDILEFKETKHKPYATSTETCFMKQTIDISHKRNKTVN
jgi:hypothetical protein